LDVTEADLIIGTSAGSTAAAQITSATPAELLADILGAAPQPRTAPAGSDGGAVRIRPAVDHMERTSRIIAAAEDAADMRRRLGAAALEMAAASDGSGQRWRATVAARLPSQRWPERTMLITAVDAHTGEPVVFDRHSGVDWWTPWPPAVPVASPTASAAADTSTAATDPSRERRSGSRIRTGAGAVTIRRQITDSGGLGHASRTQVDELRARGSSGRNDLPG
jgi:NTE family protein